MADMIVLKRLTTPVTVIWIFSPSIIGALSKTEREQKRTTVMVVLWLDLLLFAVVAFVVVWFDVFAFFKGREKAIFDVRTLLLFWGLGNFDC